MNRTALTVIVLVVLVLSGAILLLLGDETREDTSSHSTLPAADGLPTFRHDLPAAHETPSPLVGQPGAATAGVLAPVATEIASLPVSVRTLAGRVVRASDGSGLPGVQVRCDVPGLDVAVRSDEDGGFRLEHVAQSASELILSRGTRWHSAEVAPGAENVTDLVLVFDSGFRVAGVVLDDAGQPIPGAQVGKDSTLTDATGHFLLHDIASRASETQITARAPFFTDGRANVLVPRDPTEVPSVVIRLRAAGRITGTVRLEGDPTPMPAYVFANDASERFPDPHGGPTDGLGRYTIDNLVPGVYRVDARRRLGNSHGNDPPPGARKLLPASEEKTPQAGARIEDVVVTAGETVHLDLVLIPRP